jgi:DNA-binding CsgD family transcriptional regulator
MSLVAALPLAERAFGPFLDELYDAAFEPKRLNQALRLFLDSFAADDGRIFVCDRFSGAADRARLITLDQGSSAAAFGSAITLAERERETLLMALSDSDAAEQVLSGVLDSSQVSRGQGRFYLALTVGVGERWIVGLVALRRHLPFADDEERDGRKLLNDVRRAFAFHLKAAGERGFAFGDRLFHASAVALFVTRQRIVEHSNEAGAALLERPGPVRLAGRALRFEDARVRSAFDELTKADSKGKITTMAKTLAFIVSESNGDRWLAQLSRHLAPANSPLLAEASAAPIVLVAFTPFSGVSGSREALINGFVDLTATERAVLSAMVDGKDIARIALDMARSVETVRWHVRNLFAKLGVNSQADLARLGSLLLPI